MNKEETLEKLVDLAVMESELNGVVGRGMDDFCDERTELVSDTTSATSNRLILWDLVDRVPTETTVEKWILPSRSNVIHVNTVCTFQIRTVFIGITIESETGQIFSVMFETYIIHSGDMKWFRNYDTWDHAERGHKRACEMIKDCVDAGKVVDDEIYGV